MKQLIEYTLKSIPLLGVIVLSYYLFISPDNQISEGMKLSLSALLGAIASYIFIQYSEFLKQIDNKKFLHQKAMNTLEIKLNDQLNWLSDIVFHLSNHIEIIENTIKNKNLIYDTSTYREPVNIEDEIHKIINLTYKNNLLSLHTSYKKILNDITTMQYSYKFMLEKAISDPSYIDSYLAGLPNHLSNIKALHQFVALTENTTKDSLSSCRVLSRDSKNIISKIKLYLVKHDDPSNFDKLKSDERLLLDKEIENTKSDSKKIIDGII